MGKLIFKIVQEKVEVYRIKSLKVDIFREIDLVNNNIFGLTGIEN